MPYVFAWVEIKIQYFGICLQLNQHLFQMQDIFFQPFNLVINWVNSEVSIMCERIRGLREDRDLTQKAVADYLNIHQTTYSDYELGNLNLPAPVLRKLADLFETSVDYLLDRTDEKRPYPPKRK